MAVAQERLRFARDLHDLLGYSLSAITLKSELTHRLVPKNPDKAQNELVEILDISRKALADVRAVASGYRELSLENESESARSLLLAADVAVTTEINVRGPADACEDRTRHRAARGHHQRAAAQQRQTLRNLDAAG